MAELMAATFREMGLRVQWQQVEDGRANALGISDGAGGGPSLMFNGHMDTSYSGREPWLAHVPGFQPQAFVRDGRLYGLGISNMKGALACYVEAVRALRDAGVRLRGDVMIAAVCGEIEKTQQGDAVGRRVPRLCGGLALPRHARRPGGHVPARGADGGQGRARALRLAVGAHLDAGQLHPHGVFRREARPELDPAHAGGARRGAGVDPELGGRPRERLPRARRRSSTSARCRAASAGGCRGRRIAPTCSSTSACRRRRRCPSRASRCSTWCAAWRSGFPTTASRARCT